MTGGGMPPRDLTLLRGAWLATMRGPPIDNGAILMGGGRVLAAGRAAELLQDAPGARLEDYGNAVILPGLVNAHAHLELSHVQRPHQPGRFIDWLSGVIATAGDAAGAVGAVGEGAAQCLRAGVTAVGDITRRPGLARAELLAIPLRVVSYGEVVGMAGRRHVLPGLLDAAVNGPSAAERLWRGVSPHAPYSIDADGYRQCVAAAAARGLALTTHLAESSDEAEFLSAHAGPFRELWQRLGAWDEGVSRFAGGPVRYARLLGLLDHHPCSLAHVNYCDDAELGLLARGRASVVYCPRTHAYFGHPPHRWRDMLGAGVNVAVGTDSCASSPDLNLVDDLRVMRRLAPDVPAARLWEMATVGGAAALGLRDVGALAAGAHADVTVFPASTADPLAEVLDSSASPVAVWVGGERVELGGGRSVRGAGR